MPIWKTLPVAEQPVVTLTGWLVIQTPSGTRHFCGWDMDLDEAKISSPVATFYRPTMTGTTASGRRYRLVGAPCLGADARYLLVRWCQIQSIDIDTLDDVSDDYVPTGAS